MCECSICVLIVKQINGVYLPVELSKNNHNRVAKVTALGAAATMLVSAPFNTEPASADIQPVEAVVVGPYCIDNQNFFDYTVNNNQTDKPVILDVELNDKVIDSSVYIPPSSSYLGHLATQLTEGQSYKLEILSGGNIIGQPAEGLAINCNIQTISPKGPIFNDRSGSKDDTLVIPGDEGVNYLVNGENRDAGIYSGKGQVVVIAQPKERYVFKPGVTAIWDHTFSSSVTDLNILPAFEPPIQPYNPVKRKLPKKYKKECKRKIKIKNLPLTNPYSPKLRKMTKKENAFLKNKCRVAYPKIQGSNQNTRISQGLAYNWGEKPYDSSINQNPIARVQEIDSYYFTNEGKLKSIYTNSAAYFSFYKNSKNKKAYRVDEPWVGKKYPNEITDTSVSVYANNETDQDKILTVGLRTLGENPKLISGDNYMVESGEKLLVDVQDTDKLPPSNQSLAAQKGDLPVDGIEVTKPSSNDSVKYRNVVKAMFYYAIRTPDGKIEEYYQRPILIGRRPLNHKPSDDVALTNPEQNNFSR